MIDIEQLYKLPYLTFPTVVREALRAYPFEGSWSDEGEFSVDLSFSDGFTNMLNEASVDLQDFFFDRLMEIIRDYTGGHQFHRFATGEITVNEQGLKVTKDEFIPADMYDVPRKEKVIWKVRPPVELLVPGARVRFDLISSEEISSTAVQSITWEGPDGKAPQAFGPWAAELIRVYGTMGSGLAEKMLPDIPDSLASIPELTGSWAYASLGGTYDLALEMLLTVELGGSKTESWEDVAPFEYVDLQR